MTNVEEIISKLEQSSFELYIEVSDIIISNVKKIVLHKTNPSYRKLNLSDNTITKLLSTDGGETCLQLMGFEKIHEYYVLPMTSSLNKLTELYLKLYNRRQTILDSKKNTFQSTNPFLKLIEKRFKSILQFENVILLSKAKDLIPIDDLKSTCIQKIKNIKKEQHIDQKDVLGHMNNLFLFELLKWFKEFFSWVNCPKCCFCESETKATNIMIINQIRTEIFTCTTCGMNTNFPRYEDVEKLLETRKGRCGEWSKVFTLMCCALGYDARLICDETDHLWTEVYSSNDNKWLHLDPCETAFDTPLMYEVGWKKKLTYVIAYSPFEVQDVTWRYSVNHSETRKLRTKCSEYELINALIFLREQHQIGMTKTKKQYLTKRVLFELIDLMQEKTVSESEHIERKSGSLLWRITRGEATESQCNSEYIWKPLPSTTDIHIRYSAAKDTYEQLNSENIVINKKEKWNEYCYKTDCIFKKDEHDWNTVYLARQEGANEGSISWKFSSLENTVIDNIYVHFPSKTFETGNVKVTLNSNNFPSIEVVNNTPFSTDKLSGAREVILTANLSGGKGDSAWQHAQIVRQDKKSSEFPLVIKISFKMCIQ